MNKIAAAFVKAQKEFAPALKSSINPHFKSKYVGLDGCVEAVIDALNNNGIALIQETSECSDGVIVETVFLHESGEIMKCGKLHVPATKQDAQGYGSALTYGRRYSLMAACGIAPEDDDGNAASKAKPKESAKSIAVSAWDKLPEAKQRELQGYVDAIREHINNGDLSAAVDELNKITDADEKTAAWSRFESAERSAMKKENDRRKTENKEAA